jgi:hypothetical protein
MPAHLGDSGAGGGDPFETDAEYNAQRHQWSNGVDHPMPEVYSTEEAF